MRRFPAAALLGLLAAWLVAAVVAAGPASAHAVLLSTDPRDGARLPSAPSQVALHFDEAVTVGAGYTRVLTVEGERVDTGRAAVHGATVVLPLRRGLPDSGYVVSYRVASDDGHPVVGTFTFVVGSGPAVPAAVGGAPAGTDPAVAVALPVAGWLGFAGLALALGVPALLAGGAAGWDSRGLRRLVIGGMTALAAGTVASFLVQGPYVAGAGLGAVFRPALLSDTARSEYGAVLLVRLVLVVALAAALRWGRTRRALLAALGAGLVLSFAAAGHPVAGPWPWLAVPVAAVHVGAMAVWLGGLVALLAGVLRPGVPRDAVATLLPRFSRVASVSVTALVVTGVVQAVREVGTVSALVRTSYGQLLVVKLVLVVGVLAAAFGSRAYVRRRFGPPATRHRVVAQAFAATDTEAEPAPPAATRGPRVLRRTVLAEFVLGVVVLALSAVLIGLPPARGGYTGPLDVTLPLRDAGADRVRVTLDPARPGPDVLSVAVTDGAGRPVQPVGIRVTLTESEQRIGPTDVWLQPAGPGRYTSTQLSVPVAGRWTVEVTIGLGGLTAATATTSVQVR